MKINIGFMGLLFLVLLTLKLTGFIAAWSWLWVTAPLWIPFAIAGAIMVVAVILGVLGAIFS